MHVPWAAKLCSQPMPLNVMQLQAAAVAHLHRCLLRCFLRLLAGCSPICSAKSSSQISSTL